CGKSTVGRAILRLIEPDAGRVTIDGQDVVTLGARALRALRRRMQIVFQDPYGSLNPRMTVHQMLAEPLAIHRLASGAAAERRIAALLEEVGLDPSFAQSYPHELSGGQRQRVGIARALSVEPNFLVLDEPVRALAVPVPDPKAQRQRIVLAGDVPSAAHPPPGCPFHPRCPHPKKDARCRTEPPALREVAPGQLAACHFAEEPL